MVYLLIVILWLITIRLLFEMTQYIVNADSHAVVLRLYDRILLCPDPKQTYSRLGHRIKRLQWEGALNSGNITLEEIELYTALRFFYQEKVHRSLCYWSLVAFEVLLFLSVASKEAIV